MSVENLRLIGEFSKNSLETVKVNLQRWKKSEFCDIRVWVTPTTGETSELCPTRKGITLSAESLPEFIKILEKAEREVEEGEGSDEE
jgi:hypothetical protein